MTMRILFIEKGNFLALDLGGTNFRVLLITLDGHNFDMKSKIYAIPQSLMLGTGTQLFDHIAQCLALFVKDLKLENEILPLGFTFSFPLTQTGLTQGKLVRWTKGFNCSGVVGEDVVALLEQAIEKRQVSSFEQIRLRNHLRKLKNSAPPKISFLSLIKKKKNNSNICINFARL